MPIDYLDHLPDRFTADAVDLYLNAFKDKLGPILGNDRRARDVLINNVNATQCLAAICDQRLVGILSIQHSAGRFLNPTLSAMVRAYGWPGGILRLFGLALLDHSTAADELYVDGIAVIEEKRGNGIGSGLLELLEKMAMKKGSRRISLEVIDTNPKAEALYRRLGFKVVKQKTLRLLNFIFKFTFKSSRLMVKRIN
ncbi:MAG: GNAT family N-acetyltransferase [Deltaproteobacteria bacterium]|nr:GNAT family N-acetyltransferase [Deltaproteobacteria bacterium]